VRVRKAVAPYNLTCFFLLVSTAGASLSCAAAAELRYCEDSRKEVARKGEALLLVREDVEARFVRDRSFCRPTEKAVPAFIKSQDRDMCFVGYACQHS